MTIVSVRGTHGSGKSTIITKIMKLFPTEPQIEGVAKRPWGYLTFPSQESPIFIAGPYTTPCGGCDAISPYSGILKLIEHYAPQGHVLFEGALVSSSYGTVGHAMNEMEDPVFAFLDTPLELCLERVKQRRAARGNFEPLNPHNTTVKFDNVKRTKDQMARLGSRVRIVDIRHTHAVKDVLALFGVKLNQEPK